MTSHLHLDDLRAGGVEGLVDLRDLLVVQADRRAHVDVVVVQLQDRHRHLVQLVRVNLAR